MNRFLAFAVVSALALLSLSGCSTGKEDLAVAAFEGPALPVDPGDAMLVASIEAYLADSKGPRNSQYEYTRVDLNHDGLREAIVLFNLPHSYWCGWSGCTMAIFQAGDNSFSLLSKTSRIRGPLVVGQSRTNGWEDIGVRLSGMEYPDRNVLLKFDGTTYPDNPLNETPIPYDLADLGGMRIFP